MQSCSPHKESLLVFTKAILGYDLVNVEEHGTLIKHLQTSRPTSQADRNTAQNISLLLLPRGSYKTTIASTAFPMWCLENDPNMTILIDSETYNLSKSILSEIKQQYESGPYAQAIGPVDSRLTMRWAEDSIIIPSRTRPRKEGSLNAAGLDGIKAGMHYDLIIADDLHSQNNTRTQYQINGVIEHYRLLLSLLNPGGLLIVIGTRWSVDDAYDVIKEDADFHLNIPAVTTMPVPDAPHPVRAVSPDNSPVLAYDPAIDNITPSLEFYLNFPRTLSLNHLKVIESRQNTLIYSAQYLLRPQASKDKRFRDEWIKVVPSTSAEVRGWTHPSHRIAGIIDPAFTTSEYSDPSGIVILASDHQRNIKVKYAKPHKLEPFSLIETIFTLSDQFKCELWYIEEVAAQKVLRFFLDYLANKENRRIKFIPVKSGGKKKDFRIMGLQPYIKNGKIIFQDDQTELLEQLKDYPLVKHDDLIDALAYGPMVMGDGATPLTLQPEVTALTLQHLLAEGKKRKGDLGINNSPKTEPRCHIIPNPDSQLPPVGEDGKIDLITPTAQRS